MEGENEIKNVTSWRYNLTPKRESRIFSTFYPSMKFGFYFFVPNIYFLNLP